MGDAMEFARTKAELLTAAKEAGKKITPELEAQIDALAQSYMTAGLEAEEAAEKMRKIEEASERGKDALSDLFGSIFDGSMSAKEAVAQLLAEIAKAQFMKGISNLPGFGGAASFIGNLIPGFAKGGMHDGGLRMVGEKGPEIEATGPARYWTAAQMANAVQGQQGGGTSTVMVQLSPDLVGKVLDQAKQQSVQITQQGISQAAPEIVGRSVGATKKAMNKSKAGWL